MEYTDAELSEAKRQMDSMLHKLRRALASLEGGAEPKRVQSQITLARRRIRALEIAVSLVERELAHESGEAPQEP